MNRKAIVLLFIANAISGIAQGISMIAIPWYFAQKDMLGYFGTVYLVTNIISLIWVPTSGTIVDKFDRKAVFLTVTLVGGLFISIISFTGYQLGELPTFLVAIVFMYTFLNYNIHYPNLYAFVQEITERENYSKMTSIMEVIGQITTISAGAFATILLEGTENGIYRIFSFSIDLGFDISAWKIHEIFFIDAATYFAAMLIIALIKYKPLSVRSPETGSLIQRLRIGINYLKNNKPIFWFGLLSYMVFLAMLMEAFYLGVSYVNNHLQESGDVYANSKMAYAMGAIFTGFTLKYLFTRFSIPAIITLFTFATGLIFFTQFATKSVFLFFVVLFFLGVTNAGTRIARITYLFRNVPNEYFGRAGSIFFLGNIVFRIILLTIFTLVTFFQVGNNIIYAYLLTSVMLFLSTMMLIYHYKTFDLSHTA